MATNCRRKSTSLPADGPLRPFHCYEESWTFILKRRKVLLEHNDQFMLEHHQSSLRKSSRPSRNPTDPIPWIPVPGNADAPAENVFLLQMHGILGCFRARSEEKDGQLRRRTRTDGKGWDRSLATSNKGWSFSGGRRKNTLPRSVTRNKASVPSVQDEK